MSAPLKPWEIAGAADAMQNQAHSSADFSVHSAGGNIAPSPVSSGEMIQGAGRPPIPPRPGAESAISTGVYGAHSMYGPSLGTGYGGMGGIGGMGGVGGMYSSPYMSGSYGMGYSPYNRLGGYSNVLPGNTNSFVQQAESSAQGAFQSVESVVGAVSSVSMMLESTYLALQNSFRAVLGVADQFSRLKIQLTQVATSFAIFRFIRWLFRRWQVLLGLRKAGLSEDLWANAVKKSAVEAQQRFPGQEKSSWPLVVFMAIILGGPYLIWKMLCNVTGSGDPNTVSTWSDGTTDHVVGECKYDFVANREDELSITLGQRINLAPAELQPRLRENDWLLASTDGVKTGVVPASYIRILGKRKGSPKHEPVLETSQLGNSAVNMPILETDTKT